MPTAHTSQTPASGDLANGAAIALGVRFTVSSAVTCSAVAFYAPATNSGTYTAGLWQTTADDDPGGSGTGTLLASASLGSGSVTPGAWNNISITPQSLSTGTVYTAAVHSSSGRYVATTGVFTSAGLTNGGVTLLQDGSDPNPPGLGSIRNGVFDENASLVYPNEVPGGTDYFIDIILSAGQSAALGTTTETDTAFALGRAKSRTLGLPTEVDTAIALGRSKTRSLGLTSEADVALALARGKSRALGAATSTEVALPLGRAKARALGVAVEVDTALSITVAGVASIPATLSASSAAARLTSSSAGGDV